MSPDETKMYHNDGTEIKISVPDYNSVKPDTVVAADFKSVSQRDKEIYEGLIRARDAARKRAGELEDKFGESNSKKIYWLAYCNILDHAAKLKLLEKNIEHDWLKIAINLFVAVVEWRAKKIGLR